MKASTFRWIPLSQTGPLHGEIGVFRIDEQWAANTQDAWMKYKFVQRRELQLKKSTCLNGSQGISALDHIRIFPAKERQTTVSCTNSIQERVSSVMGLCISEVKYGVFECVTVTFWYKTYK